MLSRLKKLIFGVFQPENDPTEDDLEVDEVKIFSKINEEECDSYDLPEDLESKHGPLGQSQPKQFEVEVFKCVKKTGVITYKNNDYGIIDGLIYFEPSQVNVGLTLKKNDEVSYTAYKARDNETERVYKIYAVKNDSWEHDEKQESDETEKTEEITALSRVFNGRVIKRKGREFFIEPLNIWFHLDKVEASYIPIEGDWVSLEATVTINNEAIDLAGDILEVKSLKPVLTKSGIGRITLWSNIKGEGAVENVIYFTRMFCEDGYIPNLGDEVIYDAIESDQERYKWRALKVLLNETSRNNNKTTSVFDKNLLCDKNGISIKPPLCTIQLELHKTKTITLEVTNNKDDEHVLNETKFISSRSTSQLILKSPKLNDSFTMKPLDTVKYVFECRGKFLGLSRETFVFYFKNFMIGKTFEINVVGSKEMDKLLKCKLDTVVKVVHDRKYMKQNINAENVLYGPKPWQMPKFILGERKGFYKIPKNLWSAVVGDSELPKSEIESSRDVVEYAPYLKEDLNVSNYVERFHTLLYLEEISIKTNFRKYDMDGVFLHRNGEFLVLEVPGLVEQRPSLIPGDKINLTQSWSEANNVQQVGYIYEIHNTNIFVKFHGSFHETYDESECDVVFEPNLITFSRCHDAVNRSMKKLGAKWLFPSSVNEKPPQVDIEVEEESQIVNGESSPSQNPESSQAESDFSKIEELNSNERFNPSKKKLKWYNKNLNERQKLAVTNVLRGQGRPLPYIIFGPPGTGKTVTLVEVIMQIYRLLPGSRLLIATPSNSSADLICERLIDFGKYKPGQLVRLVAYCRAAEGNIPAKLVPYSTTVDSRDDGSKNLIPMSNKNNIRSSTFSQLTGRQRILVGTCTCIGSLHYLGFPPGHFTHILMDEAGQALEPEILIPATFQNILNGQVLLTGDPQQLGPVCMSKIAKSHGLHVSLLERLVSTFPYARDFDGFPNTSGYDPRFITKLTVNYRSVPEILSLPSQMFYNSELIPTVSQTEGLEADIIRKFNFKAENRNEPPAIIFHGILGLNYQEKDSPSWYNPHEIWHAVSYLRKFYTIGLTSDDVGIVTPYAKQVQKLRQLLTALELSAPKIGTVEDFQGQERNVIIVSTVRSSFSFLGSDIIHSLGFVASPRRLNVALTRARALVIILGNPVLLSNDPYWKNVVEYCLKNNSYTGCSLMRFPENHNEI